MGKSNGRQRFTIKPGAGSEESADFARLLDRMYERRAERLGLAHERTADGELVIHGGNVGQFERGVHRLVRVSPFDAEQRRHTSFVRVSINGRSAFNQRRAYVLTPYQLVRDYISGWTRTDPAAFLDGDWESGVEPHSNAQR